MLFFHVQVRYLPCLIHFFLTGKNIIGVGGKLTYHPPFLLETKHVTDDSTHPRNLSCLSGIGLLAVCDCLLNVCPSVAFNGLIVNMDYKVKLNIVHNITGGNS